MGDGEWAEAFGYDPAEQPYPVYSMRVSQGITADTLEPTVLMRLRINEAGEEMSFSLHPDGADGLADHLKDLARIAREKGL